MERDIELIHDYIKGVLSNEEQKLITNRIRKESDFAKIVDQERILLAGIGQAERANLKTELQQTFNKRNSISKWYAVAAIIPLLVVSYFMIKPSTNPQALFNEYYETYGNYELGLTRGELDSASNITVISNAYDNKDYHTVIEGLSLLSDENANKHVYIFYRGISNIELNDFEEAIKDLSTVANSNSDYSLISKWYLALSYLKLGETEKCNVLLNELKMEENRIGKKSKNLLKELD